MDGAHAQILQQGGLPVEGGEHLAGHDGLCPARPVSGETGLLRLARKGLHQHRLAGRRRAQGLQLGQRQVEHEVRGEDAGGGVSLLPLQVLVHGQRKGAQPVEVGLGVIRRLHLVGVVQEVRHVAIGAVQLADHVGDEASPDGAERVALPAFDGRAQLEFHRLVVHPPPRREAGAWDGA